MTQKAALCKALIDGEVLSIMDGFKKLGITNIPREIGRSVEREFNVEVSRTPRKSVTRYGTTCNFYQYRLNKTPYNRDGIRAMKRYIKQQTAKTK